MSNLPFNIVLDIETIKPAVLQQNKENRDAVALKCR